MTPPEKSPTPKPAELRSKQVPWGASKPKPADQQPPKATPAPPNLSAKKVPWGAHKTPTPLLDTTVTHMPWAVPTRPPIPVAPPPAVPERVSAKKVPWGWRKTPKPASPPDKKKPQVTLPSATAWALPKGTVIGPDAASDQAEMEFTRELRPHEDNEPTAEQIVAYLSRLPSRKGEPKHEATPQTPYKAKAISFEPTGWEIFVMWIQIHRRRVSLGSALLVLIVATAYLVRLVALNSQIDREWQAIDKALLDRYATVPSYVECIQVYSDDEHYALTMAERTLTAWHKARTEQQIAAAATQMERVMTLLSKIMNRYDQFVPLKDTEQSDASDTFIRLERQKERSRRETAERVLHYNGLVTNFNGKVNGLPGSLIAWAAQLHPRVLLFSTAKD